MVLEWRNSRRIRTNMLDDSITLESCHRKFLNSLAVDPSKAYFVVELNGLPVASIYFTDLDTSCVTWGCYIGVEKLIPGLFIALLILAAKFAFYHYQARTLRSEVAAHNDNPIRLNRFVGIQKGQNIKKITSGGVETEFIEYRFERCEFNSVCEKALKIMPSSVKEAVGNYVLED